MSRAEDLTREIKYEIGERELAEEDTNTKPEPLWAPIVFKGFVAVAIVTGILLILSPLAYMGVYVDVLRPLWSPVANGPGFIVIVFLLFVVSVFVLGRSSRRGRESVPS